MRGPAAIAVPAGLRPDLVVEFEGGHVEPGSCRPIWCPWCVAERRRGRKDDVFVAARFNAREGGSTLRR